MNADQKQPLSAFICVHLRLKINVDILDNKYQIEQLLGQGGCDNAASVYFADCDLEGIGSDRFNVAA